MASPFQFAKRCLWGLLSLSLTIMMILTCIYIYFSLGLPNIRSLKDYQMQLPLQVLTEKGELIASFGEKRRIPVALEQVPEQLIHAVLATEDKRFFEHPGVDLIGLVRASKELVMTGKKRQGASTITMQVARNFFLSREKTYTRKIQEILLALKIERAFSKHDILELYFNKIYLGQRAYGVAAASRVYYGKPLNQLTLAQLAMIAGLPKAPSRDNPISNPKTAKARRNHVLARMLEANYIDEAAYQESIKAPVTAKYHGSHNEWDAPYVAEMIRASMVKRFGKQAYSHGYKVYTTIDGPLQYAANNALQQGLIAYNKRHGYYGPESYFDPELGKEHWLKELKNIPTVVGMQPAIVTNLDLHSVSALLSNGSIITIPWSGLSWARQHRNSRYPGRTPRSANEIAKVGDLIRVTQVKNNWQLAQLPHAQAALVSLSPQDGTIKALTGGFSYQLSHFNRVTQAQRQPGSAFKPFIYSAAIEKGMTLSSIINDAPVVVEDYGENSLWRPQNDSMRFYGPTALLTGLIKSRNLVSIRLLQMIGIPYALDYISRFGFNTEKLPNTLSLALGSGSITPLAVADGFSVFANGGHKITPHIIDRIIDGNNETVYQSHFPVACEVCTTEQIAAPRVISKDNAFLINYGLQEVIRKGTGRAAKVLHRDDLAGKTGTTNDLFDAWFSGFNSDIVTTVWVGFDKPEALHEHGAQAALPIWINYMRSALKGKAEHALEQPDDIISVRIDPETGLLARTNQPNAVFSLFRKNNAPQEVVPLAREEQQTENVAEQLF